MKLFFKKTGESNREVVEKDNPIKSILRKLPKIKAPSWWTNFWESEKVKNITGWMNRYALLLHIPLSLFLVFIIEWMARHSFAATVRFTIDHTGAYLYNSYLVFVFFTLAFLTRKKAFMRMLVFVLVFVLGVINGIILLNRVSPFGYTDISMVGDLLTMQNTKYFTFGQGVASVVALTVVSLFLIYRLIKEKPKKSRFPFWARLIFVILAFISIPTGTRVLQSRGVLNAYFGNLAQGYSDYGYLYGFGSSIFGLGVKKPVTYSETAVKRVMADTDMGESTPLTVDGKQVNVVVVLLESFLDPTEVNFLNMSEDPIPYFHELEANYSTGHLTVPVVGAGTCDSEFEVLTGMSMQFFGPGEYPQKTVLKKVDSCESLIGPLKKQGYSTHVVHDNGANFYSRQNAFALMGFDSFTSKEMLDITDYNPLKTWPMDYVLIPATTEATSQTDGPDFTYTITVETHGDYPKYKVLDDPAIGVEAQGKTEESNYQWEYYVNMLHDEDNWIKEYIQSFEDSGEPTMVVMFGDHIPTMGLTDSELATGDTYKTKYITWNNFGMEKQDMDLTSYQLVSEYLGRLGYHGGTIMNYHQKMMQKGVEAGSLQYMYGLQMLEYDLLYGKRYAYADLGENPYPATDIVMGTSDVTIDRVYTFEDKVHLYGSNFTKWSDVYVNGEAVKTTYVSGQHLTIKMSAVEPGDTIEVSQMGSGEDKLRTSNAVIYTDPTREITEEEQEDEAQQEEASDDSSEEDSGENAPAKVNQ